MADRLLFEKECDMTKNEIYKKYRDSFDSIESVYAVADHLNYLYSIGGDDAVDKWFLRNATSEYKNDLKTLIVR